MKLPRSPGKFTTFIDSLTDETVLKVEAGEGGACLVSYRLYDSSGVLVADSGIARAFPDGAEVCAANQEVLLSLPSDSEPDTAIQYRLYSRQGVLMTCSDGVRTEILLGLRVEGNKSFAGRTPTHRVA